MQQGQRALGLAQEMGARHDFLTRVAALLHAVGRKPVQPQLLRRPLFLLRGLQPRQPEAQVPLAPGQLRGIGVRGGARRHQAQGARVGRGPQVQFDGATVEVGECGAMGAGRRLERGFDGEGIGVGKGDLAPEYEAPQLFGHGLDAAVVAEQQQLSGIEPQQLEHRQDAALGGQPRIPVPVAVGQRRYVVGELGLGEGDRVWAGKGQHLGPAQCARTAEEGGEVVRHVNGD